MMNEKQTELYYFFEDKAKRLQHEINLEIAKIGGEAMLPYRVDLLYWVEKSRGQIENCRLICRLLEDRAEDVDTETVLRKLRGTMESDQDSIAELQRKREDIDQTLKQLHEEAEYYQKALEVLSR